MRVCIIAAMTGERVIGYRGALPWHYPEDLAHFKRLTTGHALIMGRKTFAAIGRALPNRRNMVLTRKPDFSAPGADVCDSLESALELCRKRGEDTAFIIGGGEVFAQALPIADCMYLTLIDSSAPIRGDTYFPAWDPSEWSEVDRRVSGPLTFVMYRRDRLAQVATC